MSRLQDKVIFDAYAQDYDGALHQGLSATGENKHFFARGRMNWLAQCLEKLQFHPRTILDFGCGTGTAIPLFFEVLGAHSSIGVDPSAESIAVARRCHGSAKAQFYLDAEFRPDGGVDLAFCNGVFHHIAPKDRSAAVRFLFNALRPGGILSFWENNPLNPGTRYVMSRIPFDREAITLTARESRGLLEQGGFDILSASYLFIFPRMLKAFRPLERYLSRWPLGAQYQVLCRKAR